MAQTPIEMQAELESLAAKKVKLAWKAFEMQTIYMSLVERKMRHLADQVDPNDF